jgi:hypothetical protein
MSYASAGTIEAIDYNNLAWGSDAGGTYVTSSANKNVAVVWGVGNGRFGWGQSTSSIPKAIINSVTTATACTGTTITVGDSQTFGINQAIKFGSAIGGLTAGTTYYVYDKPTTNTLRVAATVNATAPIDLTTQSSLSVTVTPVDFATGSLAQVAATNNVTATQWNGLILATNKALFHTGSANVAVTGVSVGTPIAYYSAVSTAVTTLWNNANTGSVVTTEDDAALTSTNTVTWANSIGFVYTVAFASANEMRYFFNAGGKVKLSLTGPAGTGRNLDWRTLCTAMGTIVFGYNTTTKSGGSGTPTTLLSTAGNGGMWGPHTSGVDREDFLQYSTGTAYNSNYIEVLTKVTGATGSNGGKGVTLTFTINLVDDDVNEFAPAVASGTVASLIVTRPASGSLDTTAWGTITTGVTKTTDAGTTTAYVVPSNSNNYQGAQENTFTVPADVTSVSIFLVSPGGTGSASRGGGGGGSAYISSLAVTPGQILYLRVGDRNGTGTARASTVSTTTPIDSSTNYMIATAGTTGSTGAAGAGLGVGAFASAVGGTGGVGGTTTAGGGGGSAGYGGTGGFGGYTYFQGDQQTQGAYIFGAGNGGTGGGGGGGGVMTATQGGGGGGVGINGIGAPGAGGGGTSTRTTQTAGTPGFGGSGGANGSVANGGNFGGGGGAQSGLAGTGVVRIIYGPGRTYPSSAA